MKIKNIKVYKIDIPLTRDLYNLEQLWEINFESEKNKLAY